MTRKDKTGDQLLASIRKSKTGTVASKTATPPVDNAVSVKPQSTVSAQAPAASAAAKRRAETQAQDNYSAGRRVWPD